MKHCVKACVKFNPPEEGGRQVMPVGDGYAPYIRSEVLEEDQAVRVNGVPKSAQFGETISVELELIYHPAIDYGALRNGSAFRLCEGYKVIAEGRVESEIYET